MSGLGPTSRHLVVAARRGLEPSAEVAARVRAKVALAVGAGATLATTTPRAAAVAPPPAATGTIAPKAAVITTGKVGVLAVVAALVVLVAVRPHASSPATGEPVSFVVPATPGDLDARIDVRITASAHAEPPVSVHRRVAVIAADNGSSRSDRQTPVGPATLAREVELVDFAMSSLRAGDPARALATLVLYQRETRGRGQLSEDAAALEIETRCRSGNDFTKQLAAFDERWPTSVQRSRIVAACVMPGP